MKHIHPWLFLQAAAVGASLLSLTPATAEELQPALQVAPHDISR